MLRVGLGHWQLEVLVCWSVEVIRFIQETFNVVDHMRFITARTRTRSCLQDAGGVRNLKTPARHARRASTKTIELHLKKKERLRTSSFVL